MPEKVEEKGAEGTEEVVTADIFDKGLETLKGIAKSVSEDLSKSKKKVKKAETDVEDKEDDKEDDEDEDFAEKAMSGSDDIRKGVEVSAFLNDMIEEVGDSINGLAKSVTKGNDAIVKALADTLEVQKSMVETIKALSERVDKFESAPAGGGRKSIITKGIQRFSGGDDSTALTKSQIITKLTDLVQKGEATAHDMAYYESTGRIKNREVAAKIFPKEVNA